MPEHSSPIGPGSVARTSTIESNEVGSLKHGRPITDTPYGGAPGWGRQLT
jgi:hypothetical protein